MKKRRKINIMTPTEFKKLALRTESNVTQAFRPLNDNRLIRLLHCALGLSTEAGEFNDVIKKHIFYGKELDIVNLKEEAGDLLWYLCLLCDETNVDFEDLMTTTINKLKARYPNKFTQESALNRDLVKERDVLDKGFTK